MASVFYVLVMFMLYTMMVSNNNLHCQADTSLGANCLPTLFNLEFAAVDRFSGPPKLVKGPDGTVTLKQESRMRERCKFVPNATLLGIDLVLCKCKAQELFASKAGANKEEHPFIKIFNALDNDKEFAKSCGFEQDCDTAFRSVLTPCETKAREVMKTCAPMVKAATEKDLGNRGRRNCCSELNQENSRIFPSLLFHKCRCSSYTDDKNPNSSELTSLNNFLHFVNDTLRDECGLSAELYNGPSCNLNGDKKHVFSGMEKRNCYNKDFIIKNICGPTLQNPRMQASDLAVEAAPPLIDPFNGCCLDKESCKCDPSSVSCCEKLGELSKKGLDSCMCQLLNSKTTPDSTLNFLNFVRRNSNQIKSCLIISPVFTDTCVAPPPITYGDRVEYVDLRKATLRRGFRTFDNPNP